MKKEYFFITAIVLILLAYAIDSISGEVYFATRSPFGFFSPGVIAQYPLSALGILVRSIGLFLITWLSLSFINHYYFQKFVGLIIVAIISNLYAIQQMATGIKITTAQWSMSIAYAGILLLIPATIYLIKGLIFLAKPTPIIQENVSQSEGDTEEIDE